MLDKDIVKQNPDGRPKGTPVLSLRDQFAISIMSSIDMEVDEILACMDAMGFKRGKYSEIFQIDFVWHLTDEMMKSREVKS